MGTDCKSALSGYINGDERMPNLGERYIERNAYQFEWNLGNHDSYIIEGLNRFKKL